MCHGNFALGVAQLKVPPACFGQEAMMILQRCTTSYAAFETQAPDSATFASLVLYLPCPVQRQNRIQILISL